MIIEHICMFPMSAIAGASALIGAGIYAVYSIYEAKKKLGKKFKMQWHRLIDTGWQSVLAGVATGSTMGCGYESILVSLFVGIGADKIASKFKLKKTQIFNIVSWIASILTKVDKKKK